MTASEQKPKRKRRFLRYGLRSFLLAIIAVGILLNWYIGRVEKQKAAVRWIEKNGGGVMYDYKLREFPWVNGPPIENPNFLGRILGDDYVSNISGVGLGDVDDIEQLRSLPHIEFLFLSKISNKDLSPLSFLSKLKKLTIPATAIGDVSVLCGLTQLEQLWITGALPKRDEQKLEEALPNVLRVIE